MKKLLLVLAIIIILLLCCGSCIGISLLISQSVNSFKDQSAVSFESYSGDQSALDKILLIKINGTIIDTKDEVPSLFATGYVYGYEIKNMLTQAASDNSIKGVMVLVNSGGGTVLGSRAIVDGINYYKSTTHKPVYGYVQGFAASGAYMALSACDYITADYGSMTGSIGVIFGSPFQYYDKVLSEGNSTGDYIVTQNGIETYYVSAGTSKDLGNPYRKMTTEELNSLQTNINTEYDLFVKLVRYNRDIPESKIKTDIKALIYGNTEALTLGLIDKQATYEQTLDLLSQKAGIAKYQIVTSASTDFWSVLMQSLTKTNTIQSLSPLQNRVLMIYGDPSMYQ